MPGFNQEALNYSVQNGNSVTILLGDQEIGFGQTTNLTSDFGTEGLYGIGTAKPQEIQQLKFTPQVSIDNFMLTANGLKILGYPSSMLAVLANNSFNLTVMDASGTPIVSFVGSVAQSQNITIPANQPITESLGFLAMDVLDPTGVSVLNSNSALKVASTLSSLASVL